VQQLEHELDQQRNMFQQCEEDLHQRTLMLAKADARILALLQETDADKAATQGKHLTAVKKLDERAQALTAANMALQQAVAAANMEAEEMRTTLGKNASALSGMPVHS
jgi:fructose-1,6-bisphosphatase/inositol monophosphatase family enzyme